MSPTPLARSTDPDTSHTSVPRREKREEQKNAILHLLSTLGPMTDHQLAHEYKVRMLTEGWPATQLDSVRKRRSELLKENRVRATGRRTGWGSGPSSMVWEVAS